MPVYTLVITRVDGSQATTLSNFPDDKTAIADTGAFVSVEHPAVALARGARQETEFLGAWDWNNGAPNWTGED